MHVLTYAVNSTPYLDINVSESRADLGRAKAGSIDYTRITLGVGVPRELI